MAVIPETPPSPPHDRRESDQWIRDALRDQKAGLEALTSEVERYHQDLSAFVAEARGAIPNGDLKAHKESHIRLESELTERLKKEEDLQKLRIDIRNGLVKTAVNLAIAAVAGMLLLGGQTQFGQWLDRRERPKIEAVPAVQPQTLPPVTVRPPPEGVPNVR